MEPGLNPGTQTHTHPLDKETVVGRGMKCVCMFLYSDRERGDSLYPLLSSFACFFLLNTILSITTHSCRSLLPTPTDRYPFGQMRRKSCSHSPYGYRMFATRCFPQENLLEERFEQRSRRFPSSFPTSCCALLNSSCNRTHHRSSVKKYGRRRHRQADQRQRQQQQRPVQQRNPRSTMARMGQQQRRRRLRQLIPGKSVPSCSTSHSRCGRQVGVLCVWTRVLQECVG